MHPDKDTVESTNIASHQHPNCLSINPAVMHTFMYTI